MDIPKVAFDLVTQPRIVSFDWKTGNHVDIENYSIVFVFAIVLEHLGYVNPQIGDEVEVNRRRYLILEYDPLLRGYQVMAESPESHRLLMWKLGREVEEMLIWRPLVHLEKQLTGEVTIPGVDF